MTSWDLSSVFSITIFTQPCSQSCFAETDIQAGRIHIGLGLNPLNQSVMNPMEGICEHVHLRGMTQK